MTRVFKFGGALLKNALGIHKVISLMEEFGCEPLVVVVSAIGKTTNALEQLVELRLEKDKTALVNNFYTLKQQHLQLAMALFAEGNRTLIEAIDEEMSQLWEDLNNSYRDNFQAYDRIVSHGEKLAGILVEHAALAKGIALKNVPATSLIVTNSNHTNAGIDWENSEIAVQKTIPPLLHSGHVVLTQGFVGSSSEGEITTLGREGSDFTAAILASLLQANEVTIWKDVPGLMNADPNRFPNCVKFDALSYHEAIELAFYGATIIHPKTIQPIKKSGIPLYVRSFYNPDIPPTCISNSAHHDEKLHSIIVKDAQVLLSINTKDLSFIAEDNLTRLFAAFSRNKIHINMMQHSAVSFSVCFDHHAQKLSQLLTDLEQDFEVKYNTGLQLITLRHYTPELIAEITAGKKIFVEQRSRSTFQVLVYNSATT